VRRANGLASVGEHAPFNARSVGDAPALPGVYLLYRGHRLVYIGLASTGSTIQECLQRHLRGEGGASTSAATEFDYEISAAAPQLYRHYLAVYMTASGGLMPEGNDRYEAWEWLSCTA